MSATIEASLPAELWIKIFSLINSFEQLVQCSLVNSKWKRLTEKVMFSKDITIINQLEAETFYTYLIRNPEKNKLVKHLTMMPHYQSLIYFREIIPLVVTRNMETFKGSVDGTFFFRVMFSKTFGRKGSAKFKNLRTIPSAWTYCNIYDSLLHQLRHSLRELTLNFRGIYHDPVPKWKTLQRLQQITQLEALTFNSYVHDVQGAEAVLKDCGRLQHLTIHLAVEHLFSDEANINEWIETNTQQCETLKTLRVRVDMTYNPNLIDYLMYKYPSIKSIVVEKITVIEPWGTYPVTPMNIHSIKSVLDKIDKVFSYTLKCDVWSMEIDDIVKTLKSDGYKVFTKSTISPSIIVTNSSSNHFTQGAMSSSVAYPASLRVVHPSMFDRIVEL